MSGANALGDPSPSAVATEWLHILRITLKTCSLVSIGSGDVETRTRKTKESGTSTTDEINAAAIARDANGLPTIPGPGYQGVLRRLCAETEPDGETLARELFGAEDDPKTWAAGRLICGWGSVHGQDDIAVRGLRLDGFADDLVLTFLAGTSPVWRDHVALTAVHSVDGHMKFARAAIPIGTRFSLEIAAWGDAEMKGRLISVARLFRHPRFRLGGAAHRGYGRIEVLRASYGAPDLDSPAGLRRLRSEPQSTALCNDIFLDAAFAPPKTDATEVHLTLVCPDFFRIGTATNESSALTYGSPGARDLVSGAAQKLVSPVSADAQGEKLQMKVRERKSGSGGEDNILATLREPRVVYEDGLGRIIIPFETNGQTFSAEQFSFPVPGSSIKGPIAHRMTYYANKAAGHEIDAEAYEKLDQASQKAKLAEIRRWEQRPQNLVSFLGTGKGPNDSNGRPAQGEAAHLSVDDTDVQKATWVVAIDHVSIDRFTGGARDQTGALFAEETLLGAHIDVRLSIRKPDCSDPNGVGGWPEAVSTSFLLALKDLCTARIAVGSRSHGVCNGTVKWSGKDAKAWQSAAQTLGVKSTTGSAP